MSTTTTTIPSFPQPIPQRPRWVQALLWTQVLLALAAIIVWVVAAKKVKPLFAEERDLRQQITREQAELAATRADLAQSRQKLSAAREAVSFVTQGINSYHEGDYSGAIRSYDQALTRDPENAFVLDLKGYALFKAQRYGEAVQTSKESLRLDPENQFAMLDLIKAQCASGNMDEATPMLSQLLRQRPDFKNDGELQRVCRPIMQRAARPR